MIRTLLVVIFCASSLFAQATNTSTTIDPAKKAAVARLLASMHSTETMHKQLELMVPGIVTMLKSNPNITDKFADEFGKRFLSEMSTEEITDTVAKAYASHFTVAEINSLIAFYDSPTGKKLIQVQPDILSEISPRLQQYGQTLGQKVAGEIIAEHPDYIKGGAQ